MALIAFDSNILIYVLEANDHFSSAAQEVFLHIERVGGVCSTMVVAESLHGTIRTYAQLTPLQSPSIQLLPVTATIAEKAGQLRETLGIKTPDAIHIATALEAKASKLITNDQALWKLNIPNLEIKGL